MKGGPPSNDLRMSLEPAAALRLNVLQFVKRTEDPIGQRLVGERPQAFCGLKLRRMRWQKEQMQPFGNLEPCTLVPARLVEDQGDVFVGPHLLFFGEGGKGQGED